MFRDELESGEGDVTVWINSPGGNVFAAAEIYTMLKDYKAVSRSRLMRLPPLRHPLWLWPVMLSR